MKLMMWTTLISSAVPYSALSMDILPNIEAIDVLSSSLPPKYKDAVCNAQRAFIVQSGIRDSYVAVKQAVNKKASRVSKKTIEAASSYIKDVSPIDTDYVVGVAAGAYTFLIQKSFQKTFNSPYTNKVKHYIKWSPSITETGIIYRF